MDTPAALEALHGYLQQISSIEDPVKFRPTLIDDIKIAAQEAREELESTFVFLAKSTTVADKT